MDGLALASEDDVARTKNEIGATARLKQRRQMLVLQAISYGLGNIILLIYASAGTVPATIPIMFFLSGMGLTALFGLLSELQLSDRFEDHFLTTPQAAANM